MATLGIINITPPLGFRLCQWVNLGNIIHQFFLGQHTSAVCKTLKVRSVQRQAFVGGEFVTSLLDSVSLIATYGLSLPGTFLIAQGAHFHLWVLVATLLGPYRSTTLVIAAFSSYIGGSYMEL